MEGEAFPTDHGYHSSIFLETGGQQAWEASVHPRIPMFCMEASLSCLFEMEDLRAKGWEAQ